MNFNSSGYFAYKKSKIQNEVEDNKKPISRLSFLFQLFLATFVIIFIAIVVSIMKYSSKMDIEYTKGELQLNSENMTAIPNYGKPAEEDQQRKIDKRLLLIQQEENAPSEARIVEKNKTPEVISEVHLENMKKMEKLEKQKKLKEQNEAQNLRIGNLIEEVKLQKKIQVENIESENNVTIMSKVLVGRFNSFEDAQRLQGQIKAKNPSLQPFVRKVGTVFSVQMGSYQDFGVARTHAQELRAKGFDVWIYQQ